MRVDIEKYIATYLNGEISDEGISHLNEWLEGDPEHKDQLELLKNIWKTPMGYPDLINMEDEGNKVWQKILNGDKSTRSTKPTSISPLRHIWKYAAVLLIVMGIGYIFWINSKEVSEEASTMVMKIERTNPLGQKSKIHLLDGSSIFLNAGSKISYFSDFNHTSRKLNLEGEAYFEVAKNPDIPFEVYTNGVVVTALGTSFNIKAFKGNNIESIALNTGKVKISRVGDDGVYSIPTILVPGDMAILNRLSGAIDLTDFKGMDPFGWKDGRIVFHHASFDDVIEVLSRWYNVEFDIKGSLQQEWNYSSTFENEVLENVLESLKFSEKINYTINGSIIKLTL